MLLGEKAIKLTAPVFPLATNDVPSIGSTAISRARPVPVPTFSPLLSMGALSFCPSPITMVPAISIELRALRIASTAAASIAFLSSDP